MVDESPNNLLDVTVRDRKELVFSGPCSAVSSQNEKGPFDVLPQHANFISLIEKFLTVYPSTGQKRQFPVDTGILEVSRNKVEIYLGLTR